MKSVRRLYPYLTPKGWKLLRWLREERAYTKNNIRRCAICETIENLGVSDGVVFCEDCFVSEHGE